MAKKKLYLSNTSINTFMQCKRKFKYKYIDKVSTSEKVNSKHISFGNSMHLTLADFNNITNKNYRTLENLHNLLRKNWIRDGYESRDEERNYGLMGLDMLTKYYSNPLDQGTENLIIEEMIYKDCGDYILCGKLDKVYFTPNNIIEIIDYKTGTTMSEVDDLQLPIYSILAHEKLGVFPKKVGLYYLFHNKKLSHDVDEDYLDDCINFVYYVCNTIFEEKDFTINPTVNCKSNCEYYTMCCTSKDEKLAILNKLDYMKDNPSSDYAF